MKVETVAHIVIKVATITNAASSLPVRFQQPREPPSFHGSPCEDPEEWLDHVKLVRIFNRWDDKETLRQVFFHLEDLA